MKNQPEEGPDQGWSWVVAFAACSVSLIVAGICRTFGVLMVAIISEFHTTRAEASWPFFLNFAVFELIGIVVGPLGHRFGVRPLFILGSLISTVGFAACYFATSLTFITISIGIIFGIGCGLAFTLMPVIVNQYFLKFRATASGIAHSGSCFGSVILPYVYEYLTFNFGVRGCFLLTGGIVLQTAISGVLMRPPSWIKKSKTKRVANIKILDMICSNVDRIPSLSTKAGNEKSSEINISYIVTENDSMNVGAARQGGNLYRLDEENNSFNYIKKYEMDNAPIVAMDSGAGIKRQFKRQNISEHSKVFIQNGNKLNKGSGLSSAYETQSQDNAQNMNCTIRNEDQRSFKTEFQVSVKEHSKTHQDANVRDHAILSFSKEITAISGNFEILNCNLGHEQPNESIVKSELLQNTDTETLKEENVDSVCNFTTNKSVIDSISEGVPLGIMQSFSHVVKSPMFHITAIADVSFYFLYHMYVVIIIDFLIDRGISHEKSKHILFTFALSDLIGRLCFGWITDRKFLRRSHFVMICMILMGLVFISYPFVHGYEQQIIISCVYGVLLGCTLVILPILLVDYVGLEFIEIAQGCVCFLNGVGTLIWPFVIGYFRDNLGSYSNMFYVLGAISLIASPLWLLENYFIKVYNRSAIFQS